jgi:hypothetical protein
MTGYLAVRTSEYLKIAICRPSEFNSERIQSQVLRNAGTRRLEGIDVPARLGEIRVLTDTWFIIDMSGVALSLCQFPALRKFALTHAKFGRLGWGMFFRDLAAAGARGLNWRLCGCRTLCKVRKSGQM